MWVPGTRVRNKGAGEEHRLLWEPDSVSIRRATFNELPFEDDYTVQFFISEHQDGAMLQDIADYLGVSRQAVHLIMASAIAKLQDQEPW
jgi:hypothetical protein